ncbi:hypothetical protein FACS189426_09170 [Bacteroidia bacterium]|nr:hypothetical protein FACS189426_09170 [Bacteroidia bacterium]
MPFVFTSCEKDNDETSLKGIEFEEDDVIIGIEEQLQLTVLPLPDKADLPKINYSSDDESIVTISKKGKITGIKAGKTTVYAETADGKFEAECDVTVRGGGGTGSGDDLYREPYLKFGASASDIKKYETREIRDEDAETLAYHGENNDVNFVLYMFNSKKYNAAGVAFNNTSSILNRAIAFLKKNYDYLGIDEDGDYVFLSSDEKILIFITKLDSGNYAAIYQEAIRNNAPALRSSGNFKGFVKPSKDEMKALY